MLKKKFRKTSRISRYSDYLVRDYRITGCTFYNSIRNDSCEIRLPRWMFTPLNMKLFNGAGLSNGVTIRVPKQTTNY